MNRFFIASIAIVGLLPLVYLAGPKASYPAFDNIPIRIDYTLDEIQEQIIQRELAIDSLKPNNEAKIIWADSIKKTKDVLLYMHGFSASQYEGDPIHRNLAKTYGCNLVLARFPECGVYSENALLNLTPDKYIDYGKEIINQAAQLGDNLYIISTSTGSTVSAYLANNDDRVKGLIMLSPNFAIKDPFFDFLDGPWGQKLLELNLGSKYRTINVGGNYKDYWNDRYRIEALVALDYLVSETMTDEVFKSLKTPYYIGYYDEDPIISVERIKAFYSLAKNDKSQVEIFKDANAHVIGCASRNPNWEKVQQGIASYLELEHGFQPSIH